MVYTTNSLSIATRGFLNSANTDASSGNLFELDATLEIYDVSSGDLMGNDIEIVRKTTLNLRATITRSDTGAAYDLTGFTMSMTVKKNVTDTDTNAIITTQNATIASPTSGIGVFTIAAGSTNIPGGEYWYDIRITDGTNQYVVVGPAKFIVKEHVTSR